MPRVGDTDRDDTNRRDTRKSLRKLLKKKKLGLVRDPHSSETVHTLVEQNEMLARMRAMRELPEEHRQEVDLIREEERLDLLLREKFAESGMHPDMVIAQPRAVKQLNLLERMTQAAQGNKISTEWSGRSDLSAALALLRAPSPSGSIH